MSGRPAVPRLAVSVAQRRVLQRPFEFSAIANTLVVDIQLFDCRNSGGTELRCLLLLRERQRRARCSAAARSASSRRFCAAASCKTASRVVPAVFDTDLQRGELESVGRRRRSGIADRGWPRCVSAHTHPGCARAGRTNHREGPQLARVIFRAGDHERTGAETTRRHGVHDTVFDGRISGRERPVHSFRFGVGARNPTVLLGSRKRSASVDAWPGGR